MSKIFSYSDDVFLSLERGFSPERLQPYVNIKGTNLSEALELYAWNSQISAAFYVPLQGLEILLRNTFHNALVQSKGSDWFDVPELLKAFEKEEVAKAAERLAKEKKPRESHRIVAELSFGFWLALLRPHYTDEIWIPVLSRVVRGKANRKDFYKDLDYMRTLRNRIAHHQPIFKRHLLKDYQHIIDMAGKLCPDTARWIDHHNEVQKVLLRKPSC
jgi:Abi-like protein